MQPMNFNDFWREHHVDYELHPTYVYRKRVLHRMLRRLRPASGSLLFDLGCGAGGFLASVQREYGADGLRLAGCDVCPDAIAIARRRVPVGRFFDVSPPDLDDPVDVFVCSEVLEHVESPAPLVQFMADTLREGGSLLLSLPSGKLTAADAYFGHLRHYRSAEVQTMLESVGLEIRFVQKRGFPLVCLQKRLMSMAPNKVADQFVRRRASWHKRALFALACGAFRIHDFIPAGPQLFALAVKPGRQRSHG